MSKLGLLLKLQLYQWMGINKALHSRDRLEKWKLLGFGVLMLFVGISLLFVVVMYDTILVRVLDTMDALELLPGIMMTLSSLITLFTTIYKTNGLLFGFRDADTVLSMPVPTGVVAASRLLMLYGMNLFFTLLIMIPAGVIYFLHATPTPFSVAAFILTLPALPLVPIILAAAVGLVITLVSSGFRHKNAVYLLLMLALIIGVFLLSFNMETVIDQLAGLSAAIMEVVEKIYPLAALYMTAVGKGEIGALVLFLLVSMGLFSGFSLLVGWKYRRIHSLLSANRTSSNYRVGGLKASTPMKALYIKELRRYFSSALYVTNTVVGCILSTVTVIALVFLGPEQLGRLLEIPEMAGMVHAVLPLGIALLTGICMTSASSISLEGHHFWILKTLPVPTIQILYSKIAVNLTIILPFVVVDAVLLAIAMQPTPVQFLLLLITPATFALLISTAGLLINLAFPNFDWTNEAAVIKQSPATLLSMLVGLGAPAVGLVALFATGLPPELVNAIAAAAALLLSGILLRILHTWGVKTFWKIG